MQRPHISDSDSSRLMDLLEENLKGQTEVLNQLQALQASEFKYRTILEELDLGYVEVDLDGVVTHIHPRFVAITGYQQEDLVGTKGEIMLDEEGRAKMKEVVALRQQGQSSAYELPVKHRLGHRIWLLITGAPIRNLDGEVVGSVGIHFDISERKMLELETNRALASEAYARNRERGLLMKMSHEIRTPINAINGMLHLMNNMTRSPEQEAIWQGAIRATNMLRKVVDDVLDLSKIEVGKPALNLSQINVVEVTSGVAKMHHLLAEEKGIELDCGCQLSNKQRTLDVDKWLQILTNLLGNAIKYTESGTVVLSIHDHPDKDDWIAAEVTDEGPGIPKGQEERIFQPFGLLDTDSILLEQPHAEGSTGLGLSIARELAQLMGGALRLMPSQKGAKFLLEVPAPAWASGTESNPGVTQSDDDLTVPQWDGRGLRVLMAEDNDINVLYAKALFERWNVELHISKNGEEALGRWLEEPFDVILLDVQMPVMDGLEVLCRIRMEEHERVGATPSSVFMVTAFADDETRKQAKKAGATGFLPKPYTPSELKKVLLQTKQHIA
ncbi:MAG: response regulator [Bacteroidota bacterium]|nr:response regulator [Bacteroidota bacterium]